MTTPKYKELENKIKELQNEVDRLKKEESENKLPEAFQIEFTKNVIVGVVNFLTEAFSWSYTPQGYNYWHKIHIKETKLTDKDIIQLQKWVIIALEEKIK